MGKEKKNIEYSEFVRKRITELRLSRGLSEYQLSYDLGHSRGYIFNISSGKSMPSLNELIYICDYFGITPEEFFATDQAQPELVHKAIEVIKTLNDEDLLLVLTLLNRLKH